MSEKRRIVVLGGSAAGPKAAARARRLDPEAEITIVQRSPDLSMASCGYPYYVGGSFDDRDALLSTPVGVVRDAGFYRNAKDIRALVSTEATAIDREAHTVTCRPVGGGDETVLAYDRLVIATGATPIRPPLPGIDLEGVTTLQSMEDTDYLRGVRDGDARQAVVIGGGLIGVETCEALRESGLEVTLVERLPQTLSFLDQDLARLVENHMQAKGVEVVLENAVAELRGEGDRLVGVTLQDGTEVSCQVAVVAVGVRPEVTLARAAGLEIGERGGLVVDEHMRTSDPSVYAVGDCVELVHLVSGARVHAPFGDLANLQGRVAGTNLVRGDVERFPGTLLTGICKVFDFGVGSTGLTEDAARQHGFDPVAALAAGPDKPHFMGAKLLYLRLVADRGTRRLLGAQVLGPGDVSKRLASAAMALHGGLTVDELAVADLPYAPPYSSALDNLITAVHVLANKLDDLYQGISCGEVKARLDGETPPFMLDVRGPPEYEQMRLGVGEVLIPLGALRERIGELPEDQDQEIVCYCKISLRGYEAARILRARGYRNVKVMEGGVMAWPFPREK